MSGQGYVEGRVALAGMRGQVLSAQPSRVYAGAVRLRIALIVLTLVMAPAVAFAVAKNHPASHPIVGWTAYPAVGGITDATPVGVRAWAASYQRTHPDATCTVTATQANCHEYDPATGTSSGAGVGIPVQSNTSP